MKQTSLLQQTRKVISYSTNGNKIALKGLFLGFLLCLITAQGAVNDGYASGDINENVPYGSHSVGTDSNKTCLMSQTCMDFPEHCGSPQAGVNAPILDVREPAPIQDPIAMSMLWKNCPMYNTPNMPVCCIGDQAHIMDMNFNSIDSVFGKESGTCGVNLKILWCHYTCDPLQNRILQYGGQTPVKQADGSFRNFTEVTFSVDENYACTIFRSCRKVSIVAMADLQSSIAFLDFLGVSGQNTSISIITFTFNPLQNITNDTRGSAGFDPLSASMTIGMTNSARKKCGIIDDDQQGHKDLKTVLGNNQHSEKDKQASIEKRKLQYTANNTGIPLVAPAYPCKTKSDHGSLAGYINVTDPTCTFCEEVCEPPQVNDHIGFFDGFDKTTVSIVYGALLGFTILYQIYVQQFRDTKVIEELQELKKEVLYKSFEGKGESSLRRKANIGDRTWTDATPNDSSKRARELADNYNNNDMEEEE